MAGNERKRQEKLARKAARRKKHVQSIKSAAGHASGTLSATGLMTVSVEAPVHECLVPVELFEMGIGNLVLSRRLANGEIVAAFFLVDVFCLGVKNAFFRVLPEHEYRSMVRDVSRHEALTTMEPACMRKLVEGAEAYARDLGFSPHPDYHVSKLIFGDIDPDECPTSFTFGKDGKPFYVSGPHETPARSRRIVDTLAKRCGPDGFHYLVGLGGPPSLAADLDDEDLEDEPP